MSTVLVTGGTGYIGSHTYVELLNTDDDIVVVGNLSNSKRVVLEKIIEITGKELEFIEADILGTDKLDRIFKDYQIDNVIHFAGLKTVGESSEIPLYYYQNNITGTISLLQVMKSHGIKNLIFSSSATVYGDPGSLPIKEDFPLFATNPYGRTKLFIEEILRDLYKSDNECNIALLHYYNPAGTHKSGLIGEDPRGTPNNLIPYLSQVAVGKLKTLSVYGDDHDTIDGSGVKDYIHVLDLASGHYKGIGKNKNKPCAGCL